MIQTKYLFSKSKYELRECENSFIIIKKIPKGEDITKYQLHVIQPTENS